jgi:glutamyl-tRNA synthetase
VTPVITDKDFVAEAAGMLPSAPWDQTTWTRWTDAVKNKTGRKGKDLFMPLRLALTGVEHGPEMKTFLPIIGPEMVMARLGGKAV